MTRRKVTARQLEVLRLVEEFGRIARPRDTLERLAKKGMVRGNRREGFVLTALGVDWLRRIR